MYSLFEVDLLIEFFFKNKMEDQEIGDPLDKAKIDPCAIHLWIVFYS